MRILRSPAVIATLVALIGVLAVPAVAPAATSKGTFASRTYSTADGRSRRYWIYVPAGKPRKPRPLVVFLHGCVQTADGAAAATRFNKLADAKGFVVVYPQQNVTGQQSAPLVDGNGIGCWNWFLPDDQTRDAGEPSIIAGLTKMIVKSQKIDAKRVYLEGISAGANLAVTMAATYPDLYAAVGVIAGCAFMDCSDESGRLAYQAMADKVRIVPMFIENGTADALNTYPEAVGLVKGWLGTDDLVDDGMLNHSVSPVPVSNVTYGLPNAQKMKPGSGDACVRNYNFPCAGGVAGFQQTYPYTVMKFRDAAHCDVLDFWTVHGLAHAYPHADSTTQFSDPLGPDVTAAAWDFFAAHPRSACARP